MHAMVRWAAILALLAPCLPGPCALRAGEKEPEPPPSLTALLAQERYAEAYTMADAQLAAHPEDRDLALTRARCLFMTGRFAEALDSAEALAKAVPERLDVADFRADCLMASFRPSEAVKGYRPLLDDRRWSAVALKKSAVALAAAGDDAGARALVQARIPEPSRAPDDLLLLILRIIESGNPRVATLEELVKRHPENADYTMELSLARAIGDKPLEEVVPPAAFPVKIKLKEIYLEPCLETVLAGTRSTYIALDTGSQRMLLNRDVTKKLKLEPLSRTLREGWGGVEPEAVSTVLLDRMTLGALEVKNLLAQINTRDSEFWLNKAGYIGLKPFRPFVSLYDRRGGILEVHPPGASPRVLLKDAAAVSVPILWSSGLPLVPVTVNGRAGLPFLLDTGAPQTLLDKTLGARLGIRANSGKYGNRHGLGVSGSFSYAVAEDVLVQFAGVQSLSAMQLSGIRTPAPVAFLTDVPQRFAVPCYGILGRDFLNRFRMVFDGPGCSVTLVMYP